MGELLQDDLAYALLVDGVDEREESANRNGLHFLGLQLTYSLARIILVKWGDDLPGIVDAFLDTHTQVARDDRWRRSQGQVPDILFVCPPHLQGVAKTFSRDQAGLSPVVLQHGVGGHGRSMYQELDLAQEMP